MQCWWPSAQRAPGRPESGDPARHAALSTGFTAGPAVPPVETDGPSFLRFTDFRGRRILPRSLRASFSFAPPAPRDSPHPWARARTLTHTGRRACARPRAPSRGVSSAPEQIPLSRALLLTQASSRHGASSVCGSGGGASGGCSLAPSGSSAPRTESGRSAIRRRRRGEEEPRRAPRSLALNPRTVAPGKRLGGPQHPRGVGTGSPGGGGSRSRPRRGPGTRHREEWARGEGSGAGGEAGRQRCGGAPLRPSPQLPGLPHFYELGVPGAPHSCSPLFLPRAGSVRSGSASAKDQLPPLHLGQRTPRLASRGPHPGPCPASAALQLSPSFYSVTLLSCLASLCLGDLYSDAGQKLSSPPGLREVLLLLFVSAPSPGTGHMDRFSSAGDRLPCPALGGTGQLDSDTEPAPRQLDARGFPASPDTCTPPTDAAPPGPPHVLPLHGHSHPIGWTPGIASSDWLTA